MALQFKVQDDEINYWLNSRIPAGLRFREQYQTKWERHLRMYNGDHWRDSIDSIPNHYKIVVNLFYKKIRTLLPTLFYRNPWTEATPLKPGREQAEMAMKTTAAVNHIHEVIDIKRQMRLSILDTLLVGHGWLKVGYNALIKKIGEKNTSVTIGEIELKHNPKEQIRYHDYIKSQNPFAIRVSPFDIIVDPNAKDEKSATWMAQQIILRLDDVKKSKIYENTGDLEANVGLKDEFLTNRNGQEAPQYDDPQYKCVKLWEIWYKTFDGEVNLLVLADNYTKPLRAVRNMYGFDGFPYEMLRFNETPDRFYPMSDVEVWEDQQRELNTIRTRELIRIDRQSAKYRVTPGLENMAEIQDQLQKPIEGQFVNAPPGSIDVIPTPPIPLETYQAEQRVRADIDELSGVTGIRSGFSSTKRQTAREISELTSGDDLLSTDKLEIVETAVERIDKKLIVIMRDNFTEERFVSVMGVNGEFYRTAFSSRDLDVEAVMKVIHGSSMPRDKEVKIKQLLDLWNLFANAPEANRTAIMEEILRAYEFKNIEKFFAPQAMQILQYTRQQEDAGTGAGITEAGRAPLVSPNALRQGEPSAEALTQAVARRNALI